MKPFYKRHHDDEVIDEIAFKVVPRFKQSSLSGCEWRVSTVVELKRKGTVLYQRSYNTMEAATAHLPWLIRTWAEMPNDEWPKQMERDHGFCHQPGCPEKATVLVRLKQEFAQNGDGPLPDSGYPKLRAWCENHRRRGDSSREDCGDNYEVIESKGDA